MLGSRNHDTDQTVQEAVNRSFDFNLNTLKVLPVGTDGTNTLLSVSKNVACKITVSGSNTYIAKAPIGSAQSSAVWQAKKIAVSGSDTTTTWADGNANFDNTSTDLTALTYS